MSICLGPETSVDSERLATPKAFISRSWRPDAAVPVGESYTSGQQPTPYNQGTRKPWFKFAGFLFPSSKLRKNANIESNRQIRRCEIGVHFAPITLVSAACLCPIDFEGHIIPI